MADRLRSELGDHPRLSDACRATARALLDDPLMTAAFLDDRGILGSHVMEETDGRYRERHQRVVQWFRELQERGLIVTDVDPRTLALALVEHDDRTAVGGTTARSARPRPAGGHDRHHRADGRGLRDGDMMHLETFGRAGEPPLLLLHGGGVAGWMWEPMRAHLPPQARVLVPDLPGHGRSAAEDYASPPRHRRTAHADPRGRGPPGHGRGLLARCTARRAARGSATRPRRTGRRDQRTGRAPAHDRTDSGTARRDRRAREEREVRAIAGPGALRTGVAHGRLPAGHRRPFPGRRCSPRSRRTCDSCRLRTGRHSPGRH